MKPKLYMLCGVVGSGKSTWLAKQAFDWNRTVLVSSDAHIEKHAKHNSSTYNDVFKDYIGTATDLMYKDVDFAIEHEYDIVWDQTNLNPKTRKAKLDKIPSNYEKIAVAFNVPDEKELERRLGNRPGKTIPPDVVQSMRNSYQLPTENEGFDKIISV